MMDHPEGARETDDARLGFDRQVPLEFQGPKHLISREDQVILASTGRPLGECRV